MSGEIDDAINEMLQHAGEVSVCHVAQDGEETSEIFIDPQYLQIVVGKICSGNRISKIIKTKIYNILR